MFACCESTLSERSTSSPRSDVEADGARPELVRDRSIDIQNLYDRENLRGIDIDEEDFFRRPDGSFGVSFPDEQWLGILPSFGISWEM